MEEGIGGIVVRDLKVDLEICNAATDGPWDYAPDEDFIFRVNIRGERYAIAEMLSDYEEDGVFLAAAREGWHYAIERALKAEAENARLKKVVEAAKGIRDEYNNAPYLRPSTRAEYILFQALAELDKEV